MSVTTNLRYILNQFAGKRVTLTRVGHQWVNSTTRARWPLHRFSSLVYRVALVASANAMYVASQAVKLCRSSQIRPINGVCG